MRARAKPNPPSDIFDAEAPEPEARPDSAAEAEALVEAAERKRKRPRKPAEAEAAAEPEDEPEAPSTKRKRRRLAAGAAARDATAATEDSGERSALPAAAAAPAPRGPSAWTAACICAALAVAVLAAASLANLPKPLPVDRVVVDWLDGPRAPQREVDGWLATFPEREQLAEVNSWVMSRLAEHLQAQPGVGEVQRLELRHEPVTVGGATRLGRTLHVAMGMRRPFMPGVLASGQRVWLDADGVILPGSLPGPDRRRPLVNDLEDGAACVRAAVDAWRRLEPSIEPGLVTEIQCNEDLGEHGERGIVLHTRAGARLVWGRPDEDRFGRDADTKAKDLIHTLRCQGDLGRVAVVNVRFAQPFYTLR